MNPSRSTSLRVITLIGNISISIMLRLGMSFGLEFLMSSSYGSNISISSNAALLKYTYTTSSVAVGGREDLWDIVVNVTASFTDSGTVDGADVRQLYITFPDAIDEPVRRLRGFWKIFLRTVDWTSYPRAAEEGLEYLGCYGIELGCDERHIHILSCS